MKLFNSFAVAIVSTVHAIVYREDISAELYKPDRTDYAFAFNYKDGSCGATMIHPRFAISAAHCLEIEGFEEFDIELSGNTYRVVERRFPSCYQLDIGLPNSADVVVFVLDKDISPAVKGVDYVDVF